MIPQGRTSAPMVDVICDVQRIHRAQRLLSMRADDPRRIPILAEVEAELVAQFGPKASWGQSTRYCRALRGETVTPTHNAAPERNAPPVTHNAPDVTRSAAAERQRAYRQRKKGETC